MGCDRSFAWAAGFRGGNARRIHAATRVVVGRFARHPGIRCGEPEGAFYAFPDIRGCLRGKVKTSGEFSQKLLEEEQTVVTDGAGFGAEGFVRISYATSMTQLEEGLVRMKRFAQRLV